METGSKINGYIFIVDDLDENLQVLGSTLTENGYDVAAASSGIEALEILEEETDLPDLILLDVMMPDLDGWDTCKRIKESKKTKDIPVIFLTAKAEVEDMVKGFDSGGVDYITKPFNSRELLARVKTHLELKYSKEELQKQKDKLQAAYSLINNDLKTAEKYIKATVPAPLITNDIEMAWEFIPASSIGGDTFGYHMLDEDNFAFYMIDVSGHGVSSALLSVSMINAIRFEYVKGADFYSPASVFEKLNEKYDMLDHNYLFSTAWYAVYNLKNKTLKYATAGHPSGLLISEDYPEGFLLTSNSSIVGVGPSGEYFEREIAIKKPTSLFVFTDGTFEIIKTNGDNHEVEELHEYLKKNIDKNHKEIRELYQRLLKMSNANKLCDDFSILKCILKP
jgi:phosphoserine phosphatase RsbU/P